MIDGKTGLVARLKAFLGMMQTSYFLFLKNIELLRHCDYLTCTDDATFLEKSLVVINGM